MVSNSLASCAKSSSTSGSSRSETESTRDGHLDVLTGVLTRDKAGGERRGLASREAGHSLVEPVDQVAGADDVRQTLGGGILDGLAVDAARTDRW